MTRKDLMSRPSTKRTAAERAMDRAKKAEERAAADFGTWSPEHKVARAEYEAARAVHMAQCVAVAL